MNKSKRKVMQAKKQGMSNVDIAYIKALAKKEADRIEKEQMDKAFLVMLAIPLNVLVNDYWSKTAKTRAPKFIQDVISLYESFQNGNVTYEDMAELLEEYAGVKIEAEWLKNGKN